MNNKRLIIGLQRRIPTGIWLVLFIVFVISMTAMGYQFGYVGHYSNYISFIVAISFASVVMLIGDLERPFEGIVQVS